MKRSIVFGILLACFVAMSAGAQTGTREELMARHVADEAGMTRGVCVVLGAGDGSFPEAMVRCTSFFVHVLDPDGARVALARERVDKDEQYLRRVAVDREAFSRLPHIDNMADLVVATDLTASTVAALPPAAEVLRVLRPRGKAILVGEPGASHKLREALTAWLEAGGVEESSRRKSPFGWRVKVTKPARAGVDNWSHWEHGPDNNPVSMDTVIRAPYATQWLAEPYYIAMPAVTTAAGGRLFIAMGHIAHHEREEPWLNTLMARNAYNGQPLWQMKLPDGYMAHRSAYVATDEIFYLIDLDGKGCRMLAPETGADLGQIRIAEHPGKWKWIAMSGNTLYALIGKKKDPAETTVVRSPYSHWSWGELSKGYYEERVPWGFGEALVAYNLEEKKVRWAHEEAAEIDSRALAVGDGDVFFYAPDARIGRRNGRSGKLVWQNTDAELRSLIEEPGRGLGSTPGFRSTCYALYTPGVLLFEAQTHMNVVALSTEDGRFLWKRKKTTNNPNMLYLDGRVFVGIGPGGSTLAVDPKTGETIQDLGFMKRSCARLTATPDSLFCRGNPEGLTRYDRATGDISFNGAFRPSCNDGLIAANGLAYLGPWLCDCNLQLMGTIALCSASSASLPAEDDEAGRLERTGALLAEPCLEETDADWPAYRGSAEHTGSVPVSLPEQLTQIWSFEPAQTCIPTPATSAGGMLFLAGTDGKVHALDAGTGLQHWTYQTGGPVLASPTIAGGRVYVGSGDGWLYALDAANGELLWRFRAAPAERKMMVYGALCSTWPVNSGVLVEDGVAYVAAGIIDYDGTFLYALDAATGEVKWRNGDSGHLDTDLRKGVSAQGYLTAADARLWMAGGNVISPAVYDLGTGGYVGLPVKDGSPQTNRGEEIGVLRGNFLIYGGRLRYSALKSVVNPGVFTLGRMAGTRVDKSITLSTGKIPPVWNEDLVVFVNGRRVPPECHLVDNILVHFRRGLPDERPVAMWKAPLPADSDVVSLALGANQVVAVYEAADFRSLHERFAVCGLDLKSGAILWQCDLPAPALPGGLLIDRDGRVIVTLADGSLVCCGGGAALREHIETLSAAALTAERREAALRPLKRLLATVHGSKNRGLLIANLRKLGVEVGQDAARAGCIVRWRLIGPFPWDYYLNSLDAAFLGEPNVDVNKSCTLGERTLNWREYLTELPNGQVELVRIFGPCSSDAVYAYAEVDLPEAGDFLLKVGSNDGFKCWFNGEEVGRFDGGRVYAPDQDVLEVHGRRGVNTVLLKISQMGGGWSFGARLTAADGTPIDLRERREAVILPAPAFGSL